MRALFSRKIGGNGVDYESELSKKEIKYKNEPLCGFLNQSINIEYVSLILMGINNFMDVQKDQIQRMKLEEDAHQA